MIQFIAQNLPWFWFFMAILFAVTEACTMALTSVWFAAGALVLAFVAFAPLPFMIQVLLFLLISCALLAFCRRAALKWFTQKREKTNVDALTGKTALVTKTIKKLEKGEVKIDGVLWAARSDNGEELTEGSECTVQKIEGVTAVVLPKA